MISENKIAASLWGILMRGTQVAILNNKITGDFWCGIILDSIWNIENDVYSNSNHVLSNSVIGENIPSSIDIFLVECTSQNLVAGNKVLDVEAGILDKGSKPNSRQKQLIKSPTPFLF